MTSVARAVKFEICLSLWAVSRNHPRLFPRFVKNYLDDVAGLTGVRATTGS